MYEDEEEEEYVIPFSNVNKASAIQKCRCFNKVPLDVGESVNAITEILYLISTGMKLSEAEATDLFFTSTKLLQSTHPKLRRLHYILMKELSPLVPESFIASNSLMLDIKNSQSSIKKNAIRTLYAVMDNTLYNSLDRTIVECMNSQDREVVNAALVTGLHMAYTNPDMPKKWINQLTEIVKKKTGGQYAAIALLHNMHKNDRLFVMRLIDQAKSYIINSPRPLCLLVRMCSELMREDFENSIEIYKFVTDLMGRSSEMVTFEATKAICSLRNITDEEIKPAILALKQFLRPNTSFIYLLSSLSQLNEASMYHPAAVALVNTDLEMLVKNSNRTVATLAVTTLLKTGTEATVDRLITQLSSGNYFSDLGDEFKAVVVDALRVLNAKFPSKYSVLLNFMSQILKSNGTEQLKECIVDTMIDIGNANPTSSEIVLSRLSEYVDDCEYPAIIKRVLPYFADQVPLCSSPQKYVRYIYNRATLEKADVRAVAITTLAKLGARIPSLRRSMSLLLKRSCSDRDDQVRDRALFYYKLFASGDEVAIKALVEDVSRTVKARRLAKVAEKQANAIVKGTQKEDLDNVAAAAAAAASVVPGAAGRAISPGILQGREHMRKIQQLRELGEPITSCDSVALTDADSEYVVTVFKHCFANHLVLQFKIKNTMDDIAFRRITVLCNTEEIEVQPLYAIPVDRLDPGSIDYSYVVLQYNNPEFPEGTIQCTFRFAMEESGMEASEEEEYPLESFDVDIKDFITPVDIGATFDKKWAEEEGNETSGTYALASMRNVTAAVRAVADFFGMFVQGGTPEKVTTASHTLSMSGVACVENRPLVLIQARIFVIQDNSVGLQLSLRGGTEELRGYLNESLLG